MTSTGKQKTLPTCSRVNPKCCRGGSDGDWLRVIDTTRPIRIAIPELRPSQVDDTTNDGCTRRKRKPRASISGDQLPALASAVAALGLRGAARQFGVSHETVRRLIGASGGESASTVTQVQRDARIRVMAIAGTAWTKIAAEVGLSVSGVRFICRDLPPRQTRRCSAHPVLRDRKSD
jgi:hypothetical protein